MKKSLIALAVLGTFAGAAFAQTSITIYGVVDAGIVYDKNGDPAGKTWRLDSGLQSGSRLGFKGMEDLGGGTSAIFTLESGFNIDDGNLAQGGRMFGRQAWGGLKGGFGTVKLGRQLSPLYTAMDQIDPFRIGLAGNAQRAFGYGLYNTDPFLRINNTLSYTTPEMSGLSGTVSYGFGERAGDFQAQHSAGAGLAYANGPINVQLAYQESDTITLTTGTPAVASSLSAVFGATPVDLRTALVGGYFDFGMGKAHLGFADTKSETVGTSLKNRNWLVGLSAPVGAGNVMASWIRNDVRGLAAGESDQFALGYTHALTKRTNLYTSLAYTKNDANVRLNAANSATANGENPRQFNVGVRHLF